MKAKIARVASLLEQPNPRPGEALAILASLARSENPPWPVFHYIGLAHIHKKEYGTAQRWLQKALSAGSDAATTAHLISVCHYSLGAFDEAERFEKQALEEKSFYKGWMHLAAIYRAQANLKGALECYKEAIDIEPGNSEVAGRMAEIYRDQGRLDKAIELFEFMIKAKPDNYVAYGSVAQVLIQKNQFDMAEEYLNQMINKDPGNSFGRVILTNLYRQKGDYKSAIELCEELLEEEPESPVRLNYGLCLHEVGRFDEAEQQYLQVMKGHPDLYKALSNYLMCIHYNPRQSKQEIFEAHKLWDTHFAPEQRPERPVPADKSEDKRLRIGLLSGGFKRHPVGWMITKGLENLADDQFEIYCYTTNNSYDFITNRISGVAGKWRSVIGYNDEVIANMIREDEVDILIELSGHAAYNRLRTIALEPAPVIVKWVGGLFNTTGLRSVDYLITDHFESPKGEEAFYTEKLVRMPDDYICYLPPEYAPDVAGLPAEENRFITFGCFNNPSKINEDLLEQWAKILTRLPQSRLMLKSKQYDTGSLRKQILDKIEAEGISKERILFEGHTDHKEHLSCYNRVDIALDPCPYSGGVTTCEALWMGVPVITKPGPTFAGRHSATHLPNAGFPEWVADTWEEYVETAVTLAEDTEQLSRLRSTMRNKVENSPLCDGRRFGAHLSVALREMWTQRVAGYENETEKWRDHIDVEPLADDKIKELTSKTRAEKRKPECEPEKNSETMNTFFKNGERETENYVTSGSGEVQVTVIPEIEEAGKAGKKGLRDEKEPGVFKIETKDGVTVCTPDDLELLTPYVLLEQEEWFEPELNFVRALLKPGMKAVDAGAGFGAYALPMAKITGPEGKVYAFEPGAVTRQHLEMSKVENRMENLEIIGCALSDQPGEAGWHIAETPELNRIDTAGTGKVSGTTLDAWWEFQNQPGIDFIKVDVNGDESTVLAGAGKLLSENDPILLVAVGEGSRRDAEHLEELLNQKGFKLYEFIPGPGLLAEYDSGAEADPYRMNVIAVKESSRQKLVEEGWIYDEQVDADGPEEGFWEKVLSEWLWTESQLLKWTEQAVSPENKEYLRALDYLCAAEQMDVGKPANRSVKGTLLIQAVQKLVGLYNGGDTQVPVALTLARGLNAIGKRAQAVEVLNSVMERQQSLQADLPFLLPLPEQDTLPVKTDFGKWLAVRLVEGLLQLKNVSTYFSGERELELLDMLKGNPEVGSFVKKVNKLLSKDLQFVEQKNHSTGYFRSEFIDVIDVTEKNYSYSNPEGVAVVMPCIDKKKGLQTAKTLVKKAGMPCKVIIAYDSAGAGFINVLNTVADQLTVKYLIYLAQDAYPGRYWLKMAYNQLEKSGKGLLAFNDAKWNGRIASFGMVRTEWAQKLYNDAILYPGYNSHCADDEITIIARATGQHLYNPDIVLAEIDYQKGMVGGGNLKDRALLQQRFKEGFDGLAPVEKLQKLAGDYNMQAMESKRAIPEIPADRERVKSLKQPQIVELKNLSPVIVVGMHRSGTSLLSRILDDLGVFMGNDLSPNHESHFFQKLNVAIFQELGGRWDFPPKIEYLTSSDKHCSTILAAWESIIQSPRFAQYTGSSVAINPGKVWGWKDPRNVFTLPLWLKLFPNAKIIYITRHGVDVANSLRKRSWKEDKKRNARRNANFGLSSVSARCNTLEGAFSLWEDYIKEAEKNLKALNKEQILRLEYENLLENTGKVIDEVSDFIGLNKSNCKIDIDSSRAYAYKNIPELNDFAKRVAGE